MRHRVKGRKLGRNTSQRKVLFRQLMASLFLKGEIKTTLSKAKAIKGLADKLVAKAKKGSLHQQRLIHSFLQNKTAAQRLIKEIAPGFKKRTSGFTRIIHLGQRRGDGAVMAKIGLTAIKEKIEDQPKTNQAKTKK